MIKINLLGSVSWINKDHIILYEIINNYEARLYLTEQNPIKIYRKETTEFEENTLKQ